VNLSAQQQQKQTMCHTGQITEIGQALIYIDLHIFDLSDTQADLWGDSRKPCASICQNLPFPSTSLSCKLDVIIPNFGLDDLLLCSQGRNFGSQASGLTASSCLMSLSYASLVVFSSFINSIKWMR